MTGQEFIEAFPRLVQLIELHHPGLSHHALAGVYNTHSSNLVKHPYFLEDFFINSLYQPLGWCPMVNDTYRALYTTWWILV